MIRPKAKLKIKAIKSVRSDKPQYDENGILLNPTPSQLYKMLKEAERDYWAQRKAGRPLRSITCVEDILNEEDWFMTIDKSDKFKKSFKKLSNPKAIIRLNKVIKAMIASQDGNLNNMFGDHQLTGNLKEYRELHLDGDYLLVYKLYKDLILLDGIYTHKE